MAEGIEGKILREYKVKEIHGETVYNIVETRIPMGLVTKFIAYRIEEDEDPLPIQSVRKKMDQEEEAVGALRQGVEEYLESQQLKKI